MISLRARLCQPLKRQLTASATARVNACSISKSLTNQAINRNLSIRPLQSIQYRSFSYTSNHSFPSHNHNNSQPNQALYHLEQAARSQPYHIPTQVAYIKALSNVDPMSVIRRVEAGEFPQSSEIMLEYEKAKQRIELNQMKANATYQHQQPNMNMNMNMNSPYQSQSFPQQSQPFQQMPRNTMSEDQPVHRVQLVNMPQSEADKPKSLRYRVLSNALRWIFIGLGVAAVYTFAVAASQALGTSKSGIKEFKADGEVPSVGFDDVKGCDEAKAELEEVVAYLRNPARFEKLGGKMVKGILLTGPPGTGKTLLAKAIAGEAHVAFFACSGSDFEEMYVGVGARRMRDLFTAARKKSPCIIFIDEIDAVGSKRSGRDAQAARQSLNQLLVEMDGFDAAPGVIVIGATNLPSALDPALTRPGRFDRQVVIHVPDIKGRLSILQLYAKKVPMAKDVDLETLARATSGCTGAQLFNLINSAALRAAAKGMPNVDMNELEYAKDKILMGAERASLMSAEDKRLTAYHEGGHALVALHTQHHIPLYKATILPRGQALGVTHFLPETDVYSQSKAQLIAQLDVAMGGRVAEEIIFGEEQVTTGASSDLSQATKIARAMVTQYGMSDRLGLMAISEDELSPDRKTMVDEEVTRVLDEAYRRAKHILTTEVQALHTLAAALLKYETLDANEMRLICEGKQQVNVAGEIDAITQQIKQEQKHKEEIGSSQVQIGGTHGGIQDLLPRPAGSHT